MSTEGIKNGILPYKKWATAGAIIFLLVGFFQNCAENLDPEQYSTNSSSTSNEPVDLSPVILSSPIDYSAVLGQPMNLTVTASGLDLNFKWYRNDLLLSQFDTNTLSIAAAQAGDAGTYRVEVSNAHGVASAQILVTVTTLPSQTAPNILSISPTQTVIITINGETETVSPSSVTLSVSVDSASPVTYQWNYLSSTGTLTPITTNGTSSSLVVSTAYGEGLGKYRVIVKNAYGSVYADTAIWATYRIIKSPGMPP